MVASGQKYELAEKVRSQVYVSVMDGDRVQAVNIVRDWALSNSYEDAVKQILEPVIEIIGKDWGDSEKVSLGQGYVLGRVVEDVFKEMARVRSKEGMPKPEKGPVVIGNIMDDSHGLGRKLVKIFLELDGWHVYDLGNDVLPETFVDKAIEINAPVIGASAMMLRTALNIKLLRAEIDRRNLGGKIKLAVGGAVFCQRPELVEEVGADGWSFNAIEVSQMMEALIKNIQSGRDGAL